METVKVGLIVSLVLVAALAVSNVWLYLALSGDIEALNLERNDLESQVNTLHEQMNSLNSTYQAYKSTHSHSDSQYDVLAAERDTLIAPKLSTRSLGATDERPELETPRLHIQGEVWNVGTHVAYDCILHVVAHQGAVKAIDTEIFIGLVFGENKISIDEEIQYSGDALTSWNITASWG